MFYDIFEKQCHEIGTSPFACCKAIGLNGGTAAYWKKSGGIPKRETLEKIAKHLSCTVDYLLGREQKTAVTKSQGGIRPDEIIAVKGTAAEWLELLNGMTDEQLVELKRYAEYLIARDSK